MPFTLSARADRIDDKGAALVITDYKTGMMPNDAAVKGGRAPQLPLEAAIALGDSGFPNLSGRSVEACATSGRPAANRPVKNGSFDPTISPDLQTQRASDLQRLIAEFDNPATPYRAMRRPGFSYDYDDYAHLARVAEWSARCR